MSTTFPRTRGSQRGYDIDEVEDFLEDAHRAFTGEASSTVITSELVRRVAFTMRRGGYQPDAVDAALERLEDVFAEREREQALAERSEEWYADARASAQVILDRLVRPRGQRFRRVGALTGGYSVREVDALSDRITSYFQEGTPIELEQLRTVAFSAQRGGYLESQVDLLIDRVTQVMLAVR